MHYFQYVAAPDMETAAGWLQQPGTAALAGGTDLLTELKRRIRTPRKLVSIKTAGRSDRLRLDAAGTLTIDALTTISELEEHPQVANQIPILSTAAATVGSPQIRNMGTVGGNLCQSVRCWYYRHPEIRCWLKGGRTCYARKGLNRHHAVLGKCPCVAVNPSDLAPALVALDAGARIVHPGGTREIPLESLYRLPDAERRSRTMLSSGELLSAVAVPRRSGPSSGLYLKIMERAAWSFALVSAALHIEWEGERVRQAGIVLGGVAGIPWRAEGAEEVLRGKKISDSLAKEAAETAVRGAEPLDGNAYKIPMVKNLLKRALLETVMSQK